MNHWRQNKVLPYLGLLAVILVFWLAKWGRIGTFVFLMRALLVGFGYVASLEDLREKRVPNTLIGGLISVWVLIMVPQLFFRTEPALYLLLKGLLGFLMGGLLFLIVYLVSRKGLGGGDVKLMAASGLYLGVDGVLPAMLYGSLLSAMTAIVLILLKRIGRKDAIPFVPFLYAGMLLTMFIQS